MVRGAAAIRIQLVRCSCEDFDARPGAFLRFGSILDASKNLLVSGVQVHRRGERVRRSSEESESWRLEERRREARYTLILRVGVLEQDGRSSLCLVRNISPAGVQVKIYAQPVPNARVSIRVADEPAVHGRLVWIKDETAGINFDEELDPAALLRVQQKLRPHRRRAIPRVAVEASATLRTGGRTRRAAVCDISSVGARVRTHSPLTPGDRAMVTLDNMPTISAYVRWSDGGESGLSFETPIPMQIIASWVDGRIRVSA